MVSKIDKEQKQLTEEEFQRCTKWKIQQNLQENTRDSMSYLIKLRFKVW